MIVSTAFLLLAVIQIACGAWSFLKPRHAMAMVTKREEQEQEKMWVQFRILGAILIFCGSFLGMMVLGDMSLPSRAR